MEAKDNFRGRIEMHGHNDYDGDLACKQGEKAGIRKVVDWIEINYYPCLTKPDCMSIDRIDWQAFIKDNGIEEVA